jgi:hypothetical protein
MRQALQVLAVPYEEDMLRFRKGWERTGLILDAKKVWQPVTSGLRDWRSRIPVGDVKRFEAAVGRLLDELGYARAVPLLRSLRPIVVAVSCVRWRSSLA